MRLSRAGAQELCEKFVRATRILASEHERWDRVRRAHKIKRISRHGAFPFVAGNWRSGSAGRAVSELIRSLILSR